MIFKTTKRAKLLCAVGGLIAMFSAGLLWLLAFYEPQGDQLAFRLDLVREIKNVATNVMVFRLTALDRRRDHVLLSPGSINIPLAQTPRVTSVVFPESDPAAGWTFCSPATWTTNFNATSFTDQVEFRIVAPTNDVWRLRLEIARVLSRTEALHRKTERAWENLRRREFSAIPGAWSGSRSLTWNYSIWSAPFTNKPSVNNEMTHAVP